MRVAVVPAGNDTDLPPGTEPPAMRLRHELRASVREWLSGSHVASRWWYWVAAIPAAFALWTVAVAWVTVALLLGPLGVGQPVPRAVEVSLVVFTAPFLALVAMAPVAILADTAAIRAAAVDWSPAPEHFAGPAAIAPLVTAAGLLLDWTRDGSLDGPHWAVLAGFLLAIPAAAFYLARRHDHLGVP